MPWQLPDGTAGLGGIKTTDLPLYGAEHLRSIELGSTVVLTEGEKAAKSLQDRGIRAVGTVCGAASTPANSVLECLKPYKIAIWPDNDKHGRDHMAGIVQRLAALGCDQIFEIRWKDAPEKGDAADYYGDVDELLNAAVPVGAALPVLAVNRLPADRNTTGTCWDRGQDAPQFLKGDSSENDYIARDVSAPGSITVFAAPRGLGKTHVAHCLAVAKAKGGEFRGELLCSGRVLLLDRDNSKREVRRRLQAWGAADAHNLDVMTRDDVPPLVDAEAWATFPFSSYELVILDSFSATTEGVKEADGGASGEALAPLLDLARRGPGVVVLANTRRDGEAIRGSGVLGDRADILYEVRDATDLHLDPKKEVWWECLPESGDTAWSSKAKRRKRRTTYRLAFVPSKYRIGEEPNPWVVEIALDDDHDEDQQRWKLRDVTAEVEAEHQQLRGEVEAERTARLRTLADSLAQQLPKTKEDAEKFLVDGGLTRADARHLLQDEIGVHWTRSGSGKKGDPFTFAYILRENTARIGENGTPSVGVTSAGSILADTGAQGRQESMFKNPSARSGSESVNSRREIPKDTTPEAGEVVEERIE